MCVYPFVFLVGVSVAWGIQVRTLLLLGAGLALGLEIFELRKVLATICFTCSGYMTQCTTLRGLMLILLAFLQVLIGDVVCR